MNSSITTGSPIATRTSSTPTPQEIAKQYPRLEALLYDREDWHRGPALDLLEDLHARHVSLLKIFTPICSDLGSDEIWGILHAMKQQELMLEDVINLMLTETPGQSEQGCAANQGEPSGEAWSPKLLAAHGAVDAWSLENAGLIEAMHAVLPDSPNDGDLPMWSLIAAMRRHNDALLDTAFPREPEHGKLAVVPNTESPAPVQ